MTISALAVERAVPLAWNMRAPDQIARTAVSSASEDDDANIGQVLPVNGGLYTA